MRCVKALANTRAGLREILTSERYLGVLLTAFKFVDILDQKLILEIFTFMCYVNHTEGHTLVLRAFNYFKEETGAESRFGEILTRFADLSHDSVDMREGMDEKVLAEFHATSLMLLNSLINGEDNFDARVALRTEFVEHGLLDILEKLKIQAHGAVLIRICEFYEGNLEDYESIINDVEEFEDGEAPGSPVTSDPASDVYCFLPFSSSRLPFFFFFLLIKSLDL